MVRTSPVMSVAAGRYAKALYSVAQEEDCVAVLQGLLDGFLDKVFLRPELQAVLYNPKFSRSKQQVFFTQLLSQLELSMEEKNCLGLFSRFLSLLICYSRLKLFPDIISQFHSLVRKASNEEIAIVKTSIPLSREQAAILKLELEKSTAKIITLHEKVEPNLLGGVVVQIGSLQIDTSLRTKLNSLKYALKEVD